MTREEFNKTGFRAGDMFKYHGEFHNVESVNFDESLLSYDMEDDAEMIKKNCIHFLELQKQHHAATFEIEECIAWIKKQGKKSTDKNKPRFNVGDWIVDNCGYIWKIERILNQFYFLEGAEGDESLPTIDWVDDAFHLLTIQDAKDGDVLACNEEILLFKSYSVLQGRISLYCWYNGHTNNFHSKEVIDILMTTRNKICPATKEQRDTLMKAINNARYKWNIEKKELKKKKERKNDIKVYTQYWNYKERLIIVCNEGSVFVDITTSPNKIDKKAFIWGLNIHQNSQHIGLGTLLLKYAEECIRQRNISKIEIEWEISSPLWVYNWYIRNGYKEIDFEEGYSKLCKTL